jgi:hypothetical protein
MVLAHSLGARGHVLHILITPTRPLHTPYISFGIYMIPKISIKLSIPNILNQFRNKKTPIHI